MDFEVRRKIIHAVAAIAAVPFLLLFNWVTATILAVLGLAGLTLLWYLDRRGQELSGPVGQGQRALTRTMNQAMRPEEDFPWASFYFVGGLLAVAIGSRAFEVPLSLAFAAYANLGMGDSTSALIGKAYGSLEIPWNRDKSWEGTGAGLAAAFPWALMLAGVYHLWLIAPSAVGGGVIVPFHLIWIVFVGSVVAMLVETLGGEDNLTIPLVSWAVMAVLARLVGLA